MPPISCTAPASCTIPRANENSVDIVLFLNGIPVVSMELKCQFTGQSVANAMEQYKFDRSGKDPIFTFKNRVLVHFAVDLTQVYMTTRLEGERHLLSALQPGQQRRRATWAARATPTNPDGYDTAYLWEKVLCKDRLLEILHKYLHLQVEKDKKTGAVKSERMIFPRYHQLDVVTKLLADVRANGAGQQLSHPAQRRARASPTPLPGWRIAWLACTDRTEDEKIFQSVIIVTDRRVLDSQLQNTVYQFRPSLEGGGGHEDRQKRRRSSGMPSTTGRASSSPRCKSSRSSTKR